MCVCAIFVGQDLGPMSVSVSTDIEVGATGMETIIAVTDMTETRKGTETRIGTEKEKLG